MTIRLPVLDLYPHASATARTESRAPETVHDARRLIDSHGRTIRDLRLSITDRCNFRCVYCMDPDVKFMPRESLMNLGEATRLARLCVGLGVEKVRLTGGEPTVHPDLTEYICNMAALGVSDIALTTNGATMTAEDAARWRDAGLTRVTISIDSLKPDRFASITRSRTSVDRVLESIRIARDAGLDPVRINAVIVRGSNDDEIVELARLAQRFGVDVRLIEYMPLDSGHRWERDKVLPARQMRQMINDALPIEPDQREHTSSPAMNYRFVDGSPGRIGTIASVTEPFCGACSRLRITADGRLRTCLFAHTETDLLTPMRDGATDQDMERILLDATWAKQTGHGMNLPDFEQPDRPMSAIGG